MFINPVAFYSDVYYRRTFLCALSMVYGLREIYVFIIYVIIVYFRLYGVLPLLCTIISGTPKKGRIDDFKQFFIDSNSHLCCIFSFNRTN
nr:MAG TPA: hypothetical protein [Caudoviricetes sp.]